MSMSGVCRGSGERPGSAREPRHASLPVLGLAVVLFVLALAALGHMPAHAVTPAMAGMGHQSPAVCLVPWSSVATAREDEESPSEAGDRDRVTPSATSLVPGVAVLPRTVRHVPVVERFLHSRPQKVPIHLRNQVLRN
jgi:hypothetical protein